MVTSLRAARGAGAGGWCERTAQREAASEARAGSRGPRDSIRSPRADRDRARAPRLADGWEHEQLAIERAAEIGRTMKLATIEDGSRDGALVVVARRGDRYA